MEGRSSGVALQEARGGAFPVGLGAARIGRRIRGLDGARAGSPPAQPGALSSAELLSHPAISHDLQLRRWGDESCNPFTLE